MTEPATGIRSINEVAVVGRDLNAAIERYWTAH